MICAFIAEHRARFGVAPICRALSAHGCQIAPRTFYAWAKRAPSKRALWDIVITEVLAGYYEPDEHGRRKPESLYGSLKMWAHLQRRGHHRGPVHGGTADADRTAGTGCDAGQAGPHHVADPAADRAPDLVKRRFRAPAPNRLFVADFTYVRMAGGVFAYTAFVIDAFAGTIVGWECSTSPSTPRSSKRAIRPGRRDPAPGRPSVPDNTIHHSDAGSQYTSVHFGETLPCRDAALDRHRRRRLRQCPGRDHDRALQDRMHPRRLTVPPTGRWRGSATSRVTADWVHWYNTSRLMHRLGRAHPSKPRPTTTLTDP